MPSALRYRRVLLKLSGEALLGDKEFGIDHAVLSQYARDVREAVAAGVEVALVIGGGNIFRGVSPEGTQMSSRAHADYMGMLATMINGMALQDALEAEGLHTRLVSAIDMAEIAEPFIRRRAIRHLEKGRVVVFGAGTGHPYFSTDTAASPPRRRGRRRGDPQGHPRRRACLRPTPSVTPTAAALRDHLRRRDDRPKDLQRDGPHGRSRSPRRAACPILVFNMNTARHLSACVLRGEPRRDDGPLGRRRRAEPCSSRAPAAPSSAPRPCKEGSGGAVRDERSLARTAPTGSRIP